MKRILFRVAKLVAAAYGAALLALFVFQNHLLFVPRQKLWMTPSSEHIPAEDVWLTTSDNVRLHAWLIRARNNPRATILFFHGNGGNISSTLHLQELFRTEGYDSLAVDYRGYGESEGTPSEEGLYRDAEAAWQFVSVRAPPVVIWGYSLGGGVASWLAAKHPPAALVLQSTFTSLPDEAASIYPMFPVRLLCRSKFPTHDRLANIHVPLVVIHGDADDHIGEWQGRSNYARASSPKEFVEFHGSHEVEFFAKIDRWDAVDRFLVNSAGLPTQK